MIIRGSETLLVQGITGKQGTFWAEKMRDYGTSLIGGVNPKKAGSRHLDLPVWGSAVWPSPWRLRIRSPTCSAL